MGQITDMKIRQFQKESGIEPATEKRGVWLGTMSDKAYTLIKVLALERAGIRDGDGRWYMGDPINAIIHQLHELEREGENSVLVTSLVDDDLPF